MIAARSLLARAATLGALALGAVTAALASPACATKDCEPSSRAPYTQGRLVGADYWESTPLDTDWLDFPGGTTIPLEVTGWIRDGRPIREMHGYISLTSRPDYLPDGSNAVDNWTEGSGNLVQWSAMSAGRISVTNGTCSHMYLRVVLGADQAPEADAGTAPEAGADAPAGG